MTSFLVMGAAVVGRGTQAALWGIDPAAMPPLDGYVAASEKTGAEHLLATHRGDPLLSAWRVGLGKAVAFTSDAKGRWAGSWHAVAHSCAALGATDNR